MLRPSPRVTSTGEVFFCVCVAVLICRNMAFFMSMHADCPQKHKLLWGTGCPTPCCLFCLSCLAGRLAPWLGPPTPRSPKWTRWMRRCPPLSCSAVHGTPVRRSLRPTAARGAEPRLEKRLTALCSLSLSLPLSPRCSVARPGRTRVSRFRVMNPAATSRGGIHGARGGLG